MQKKDVLTDVLVVDGYNIVGVWSSLKYIKMANRDQAKKELIDCMADYQGYSGMEVILVFDAYAVPGNTRIEHFNKLAVHYSAFQQTADQYIENLVGEWVSHGRTVHVATDDHLEQTIAFAKGAYRITARELWLRVNQEKKESKTHTTNDRKIAGGSSIGDRLDAAQKALFEKWRRENK